MKITSAKKSSAKGSSLIEAIIAVGVLAVAVPLVFGTMVQTGESSLSAQAETRSSWIVPACLEELQRAMQNQSEYLDAMTPSKEFGTDGMIGLGFSSEGKILGKISQSDYSKGLTKISNESVRYIVKLSGEQDKQASSGSEDATPPSLKVKLVIEYPATAPDGKRQKLEFYTRTP